MATTYREMVNRVMRKLGERELNGSATELTTDYEKLVGDIINDVKEEIENAHQWRALRSTESVTVAAQAATGVITNANERSTVVRIIQAERGAGTIPLCFDVTDGADGVVLLQEMDLSEIIYRDRMQSNDYARPNFFALDNTAGDSMNLHVYPRPSATATIEVTLCIPQSRLEATDLATNISIPTRPLLVGAVWPWRSEARSLAPVGSSTRHASTKHCRRPLPETVLGKATPLNWCSDDQPDATH